MNSAPQHNISSARSFSTFFGFRSRLLWPLQTKEFGRSVIGMFGVTWFYLRVCTVVKHSRDMGKHDCLDTSQPIMTSQDLRGQIWLVRLICEAFRCGRRQTSRPQDRVCHITDIMIHHQTRENGMMFLILRRLMSYIYGAPILDVSRSHTTTQHSR